MSWIRDTQSFKDFVGYVVLSAPDSFDEEDYLQPDQQMNLERAFAELRKGFDLIKPRKLIDEKGEAALSMLEQSLNSYRAGDIVRGAHLLQELRAFLFRKKPLAPEVEPAPLTIIEVAPLSELLDLNVGWNRGSQLPETAALNPAESYSDFRKLLKVRGRTLKSLTIPEGIAFFLEFYRDARVADAAPEGDGVAYSCGVHSRGGSSRFEFSMFRIFRSAIDPRQESRLRLSFCFSWAEVVRLHPTGALPESNGSAWERSDVPRLVHFIETDETYALIKDKKPRSVELRHEPEWGIH